jgi:hypothetical protein
MAPVKRVKPLAQAVNFGLSAAGGREVRKSPIAAAFAHSGRRVGRTSFCEQFVGQFWSGGSCLVQRD